MYFNFYIFTELSPHLSEKSKYKLLNNFANVEKIFCNNQCTYLNKRKIDQIEYLKYLIYNVIISSLTMLRKSSTDST